MISYPRRCLIFALAGFGAWLFFGSIVDYFKEPVAPDEKAIVEPAPLPRFDPDSAPKSMFDECRREGKVLHAERHDGGPWTYECIDDNRRRK